MDQTNHTLIIEAIQKSTYVWFEENWIHDDELHSHRKGQLIYVEQGFQYLTVAGKMYLLPQNHVAWIPSGALHKTNSHSERIKLMVLFFDPPQFDSSQEHLFFNQVQLFSAPKVLREMILYTEKWSKLREENEQERVFLGALLHELPYFCSQLLHLEITLPHESRLQTVLNHLHVHYTEAITLDEIAMLSNLSLRTIERLFKKETGMTLAKYQQLLRIIKSLELLSTKQFTISQIAYKVGYKSVQAFTNSFYAVMKYRPSNFMAG
ncbi:AraC family transcriptional regulator [Sphingobacterium multivorum]|uniref:AraC family transcriptional regulator n=1 Tax=Sphingobacterium multivorum TaxID=28454 RepID=UPI002897C9B9|nr:AraC family transcriptional regulator [Sphingobacterium multivorum]